MTHILLSIALHPFTGLEMATERSKPVKASKLEMATERSKPVKASKLKMATERAKNKDTVLILVSASYFNPRSCKIFYLFL